MTARFTGNLVLEDPLLCARGSAFLMRCLRTLFHEETALLSVRKFPFPELTPLTREKRYPTCFKFRFVSSPQMYQSLRPGCRELADSFRLLFSNLVNLPMQRRRRNFTTSKLRTRPMINNGLDLMSGRSINHGCSIDVWLGTRSRKHWRSGAAQVNLMRRWPRITCSVCKQRLITGERTSISPIIGSGTTCESTNSSVLGLPWAARSARVCHC